MRAKTILLIVLTCLAAWQGQGKPKVVLRSGAAEASNGSGWPCPYGKYWYNNMIRRLSTRFL
jgi:hypothetical protein